MKKGKGFFKKIKNKKNAKTKRGQEDKIKELCRSYKEQHPNASDDVVLTFAFRTVYGPKGVELMKKIKNEPEAYQEIKKDLEDIDKVIEIDDIEQTIEQIKE